MKTIIKILLCFVLTALIAPNIAFSVTKGHTLDFQKSIVQPEQKMLNTEFGKMSVQDFLLLTPKKIKELTGKRISLKNRIGLWYAQKQIHKHAIVLNENVADTGAFKINWGAFALGLLLGLIGIIITLFFKDKKAWVSALIGWGIFLAVFLLILSAGQV